MKISPGARRNDGTLWAQGPVRVPEWKNMPPIDWGNKIYHTWEERVSAWRTRPAKERLNCHDTRQAQDPTMPVAAKTRYGDIRWSNGYGIWKSYGYSPRCFRRGYWTRVDTYGSAKYIGETIEDVIAYLNERLKMRLAGLDQARKAAFADREGAIANIETFEHEVLGPKVLDILSEL